MQPLEQPEICELPLYGDTSILAGLVAPEDLGIEYSAPVTTKSSAISLTKTTAKRPHTYTGKLKTSNDGDHNGLQDRAKVNCSQCF